MKPSLSPWAIPPASAANSPLRAWQALHRGGPCFVALDDPKRLAALSPDRADRDVASPDAARAVFANALPVLPIKLAEHTATRPSRQGERRRR